MCTNTREKQIIDEALDAARRDTNPEFIEAYALGYLATKLAQAEERLQQMTPVLLRRQAG